MVPHKRPQLLVLWVIWAAIFNSIIVIQLALGHGIPHGENAPGAGLHFAVVLSAIQIIAATAVRWLVLPRAKDPGQLLVMLIIGLALSEAVGYFGLFLVPQDQPATKLALWLLALASTLQFAPVYAKGEASAAEQFRTG